MRSVILIAITIFFCGCATIPPMTQTEIKAFETRRVDAGFDDVFAAGTEALLDLGYSVSHSDKASGILAGERAEDKEGADMKRIAMMIGGTQYSESDLRRSVQLTLYMRRDGDGTKVRIKTAYNNAPILDKKRIDEVWLYIERQVLMESGD